MPNDPERQPRISIVIPVLNDDAALSRLLSQLRRDLAIAPPDEIIVVVADGTGQTITLVEQHSARSIGSKPGRGRQMNAGAAAATGDVLWFLHADAYPDEQSAYVIRNAIRRGQNGGWFRFRFHGYTGKPSQWLSRLVSWRARRGVAYGDQGLFFRRDLFETLGGFTDAPLFEEVALVRAAKARGGFDEIDCAIGVDARRWEETGWIRRTLINRGLALGFAIGVKPATLARWYHRL